MSVRSLQREQDSGRGWTDEQRAAYREQRIAQKVRSRLPGSQAAPVLKRIEPPVDTSLIDL